MRFLHLKRRDDRHRRLARWTFPPDAAQDNAEKPGELEGDEGQVERQPKAPRRDPAGEADRHDRPSATPPTPAVAI